MSINKSSTAKVNEIIRLEIMKTRISLAPAVPLLLIIEAYFKDNCFQLYSLLGDSERLSEVDNSAEWRQAELQKLTDLIQKKIEEIQNPLDCVKSKYEIKAEYYLQLRLNSRALICNLDKECGFGCQMHHVAYCFLTAFATGRMLVLNNDGKSWRLAKFKLNFIA